MKNWHWFLSALLLSLGVLGSPWPPRLVAAEPFLLADINQNPGFVIGGPSLSVGIGDLSYFAVHVLSLSATPFAPSSVELWVTDGSSEGTTLAANLPGDLDDSFGLWGFNGRVYFRARSGLLWVSDGTEAGTHVAEVDCAGPCVVGWHAELEGRLLVLGSGQSLYASDGSSAGTSLIASFPSPPVHLTAAGGRVFFFSDTELWTTDGTPEGTRLLQDLGAYPHAETAAVGDRIYFHIRRQVGETSEVTELWVSDGTQGGTRELLSGVTSGFGPGQGEWAAAGNRVYLVGFDALHGRELWATEGSPETTGLFVDIAEGPESSQPASLTVAGGRLFFEASLTAGGQRELWVSEGTSETTRQLMDGISESACTLASPLVATAEEVFFLCVERPGELWRSDGTIDGTRKLHFDSLAPFSYTRTYQASGNHVFIFGSNELDGHFAPYTWWVLDARSDEPALLDLNPLGRSRTSYPKMHIAGGHALIVPHEPIPFFSLKDPLPVLWVSDGTPAGASLLQSFSPLRFFNYDSRMVTVGNRVFFRLMGSDETYLATSDGTEEGTGVLGTIRRLDGGQPADDPGLPWNGGIAFPAFDELHGQELWVSGGTPESMRMLVDVVPGPDSSFPQPLGVRGSDLFFAAEDGTHGRELWVTDGTAAGTRLLVSGIQAGPGSQPAPLVFKDRLFFLAQSGMDENRLWVSDGTQEGTYPLADGRPEVWNPPWALQVAGDLLLLYGRAEVGLGLWATDGTLQQPHLLMDHFNLGGFLVLGVANRWAMVATYEWSGAGDGISRGQLWGVNTESEEMRLIQEETAEMFGYWPVGGSGGDLFYYTHACGDVGCSNHRWQLWSTDGTEAGTRLRLDSEVGEVRLSPAPMWGPAGNYVHALNPPVLWPEKALLLFPGNDGIHGSEPWALPLEAAARPVFRRGDCNDDGRVDISDALCILGWLFLGNSRPVCLDAADADDNGTVEITDAVRVLGYLFLGSDPPAPPGPDNCGEDPAADNVDCEMPMAPCE